jgi:FAD/FMN-containing dehydrogenase
MSEEFRSWGRFPIANGQRNVPVTSRLLPLPEFEGRALPRGNGRSYGDSCLNAGGALLTTRALDHFISFDPTTGVLRAEAGVTLADVISLALPFGWFLPVTPGTRWATLGGAIANDVHGKNHHAAGSFGHHVRSLELLRSDGTRQHLVAGTGSERLRATIGGMGLTGLVTHCEIQLRRVPGPWLDTETVRFGSLSEFFALSSESAQTHEYTVAWIDCLAKGRHLGRGHFIRSDHAPGDPLAGVPAGHQRLAFPITPPVSLVNRLSLRPFNTAYYWRQRTRYQRTQQHYQGYFYPLDGISGWNRMYGPRGFLQHQCVLPPSSARDATAELLRTISRSGHGSFLAVLKEFGDMQPPGMLSFPRPGTTLALDFPNTGPGIFRLLEDLDQIVADAGGALYPAKDARMSPELFRRGYGEQLATFSSHIDPRLSSGFWRRMTE